jgi:hypothetical protein
MVALLRPLLTHYLLWRASQVRAEREQYQQAGIVGPRYLFNSHVAELEFRMRAAAMGAK